MAPDPEKAFIARLRAQIPGVYVGTTLTASRPAVRVILTPGGFAQLRHVIDGVQLNLACYGADPRGLASQVRDAVAGGFVAAGHRVFRVETAPAFPLPDFVTYEVAYFVPCTASVSTLRN